MKQLQRLTAAFVLALTVAIPAFAADSGPAIGSKAPDFSLVDTNGKTHALADYKGRTVVLEWINLGCPFVKKHYDGGNMQKLQKKWSDKGVVWLSICSSAAGKEGSLTAAEWNTAIGKQKIASTVLLDESGVVGKSYDAKTTPHMYIIDGTGNLIYKGAIDDKSSYQASSLKGAKNYVDAALTETTSGKAISVASTEPYGCSVKYK